MKLRLLIAVVMMLTGILAGPSLVAAPRPVSYRAGDRVINAIVNEAAQRPAPAVVLVPMLGRPKEDWQAAGQRLAEANITALLIDLPGQVLPGEASAANAWGAGVPRIVLDDGHQPLHTGFIQYRLLLRSLGRRGWGWRCRFYLRRLLGADDPDRARVLTSPGGRELFLGTAHVPRRKTDGRTPAQHQRRAVGVLPRDRPSHTAKHRNRRLHHARDTPSHVGA